MVRNSLDKNKSSHLVLPPPLMNVGRNAKPAIVFLRTFATVPGVQQWMLHCPLPRLERSSPGRGRCRQVLTHLCRPSFGSALPYHTLCVTLTICASDSKMGSAMMTTVATKPQIMEMSTQNVK